MAFSTTTNIPCNQTTDHAIINNNVPTTNHITYNNAIMHNNNYHTDMGGDFYFSYKYQKISPPYPTIIIYNLLTNR